MNSLASVTLFRDICIPFFSYDVELCMIFEARLHVKREGTARLETSTGSRRNLLFTRTNSVMCPTEKGTVRESSLERVLDCLHVVFFETGNDRARDN